MAKRVIYDGDAHLSVRYDGSYRGRNGRQIPHIYNLYNPVEKIRERAEQMIASHRAGEEQIIWISVRQQDGTTHLWTPSKGWVQK